MAKTYLYRIKGKGLFIVVRIDDSKPRGHKDRYKEYDIDLRKGESKCSCDAMYFSKGKKACKHIKDIFALLKDKNDILDYEKHGDYERLALEVKMREMRKK